MPRPVIQVSEQNDITTSCRRKSPKVRPSFWRWYARTSSLWDHIINDLRIYSSKDADINVMNQLYSVVGKLVYSTSYVVLPSMLASISWKCHLGSSHFVAAYFTKVRRTRWLDHFSFANVVVWVVEDQDPLFGSLKKGSFPCLVINSLRGRLWTWSVWNHHDYYRSKC